ncbi:MAG: DegQ family serine endoprotease [Desulfovibrionaceae bacterium]
MLAVVLAWAVQPALASAKAGPPAFTELAKAAGKAVVNISTVRTVDQSESLRQMLPFGGGQQEGPLQEFFDQFKQYLPHGQPKTRKQHSLGSGFIISPDGYVVTNNHVIAKADEVTVKLFEAEKEIPATVVGRDPETDLALLKIEVDHDLPVLQFADSEEAEVGEWVVAIGNPFGLGHTVTAGILSAKGRFIGAGPFDDFLQTDASINPGNSGGPLLDMAGKVVGVNSAIVASGQGIGFATPSNMARSIIKQLKEHKKVSRGWLGVTIQDVTENEAKALGLPEPKGALVASVVPDNPAAKAGLEATDVILAVNGEPIEDSSGLLRTVAQLKPGDKIKLRIWRGGKEMTRTAVLGERSQARMAQRGRQPSEEASAVLGLSLRPVDKEQEARALGLDKPRGLLVVDISTDSPAAEVGLQVGDVILTVNQQPVNSVGVFSRVVETEGRDKGVLMLLIKRRGQNIVKTVPLSEQ